MNKTESLFENLTEPDYWETTADAVVAHYKRLEAAMNAADDAGCIDPDGPLFDAVWGAFEEMLNLVDRDGWIHWFIYENQCGKRGLNASEPGKKPRNIRTTKQLAKLIRSNLKR